MSPLTCAVARPFIVAGAFDGQPLNRRVEAHRKGCLRCQAVEVRARATGRTLHSLDHDPVDPPTDLAGSVVEGLDRPDESSVVRPGPVAFGVVVAVATVVVVLRRRRR